MYDDMSYDEKSNLKDKYFRAAKVGNIEYFIDCIDRGVPIETVDHKGDRLNVVEYLIKNCHDKINVDVQNFGYTAFHFACIYGHIDVIKFLHIEGNCNVNIQNSRDENALHIACYGGLLDIAKYLIMECKININVENWNHENSLHYSIKHGKFDIMKYLIKECNIDIDTQYYNGCTALHYSLQRRCNIEIVKYLINDCNANIDAQADNGSTALHYLTYRYDNFDTFQYLIKDCNPNVNIQMNDGSTALHLALQNFDIKMMKLMIEDAQADLTITTNNDENVFDFVYDNCHCNDLVVMLLRRLRQPLPPPKRGLKRTM